jgi:tetratricopeptide (TPR) repeat protein
LLGLSLISSAITFKAQSQVKLTLEQLPFSSRLINAIISCAVYLRQLFWPSQLATPYPYPAHRPPVWEILLAVVLLGGISIAVFDLRKSRPWLLVGWLWYLVMLAPVIGIFQVGQQAHADRYTYLPQIGVSVLLTWLVADWLGRWRMGRYALVGISLAVIAVLMACAGAQAAYWQNNETLWTRALACTSNNFTAEANFGAALLKKHNVIDAVDHFQKALAINPRSSSLHANLGLALQDEGQSDRAVAELQQALEADPKNPAFHNNLGAVLFQQNKPAEAAAQFEAATQIEPNDLSAQNNLGNALLQMGNTNAAISHYEKALALARATGHVDLIQRFSSELNALRNEPEK